MSREGALAVMIGVAVLIIAVLAFAWWRRSRRDADLRAPGGEVPADATVLAHFSGLYVATTRHEEPLERLAIRGLGFRSRLDLTVTDQGLGLALAGAPPLFLATGILVAVDQSTVAIDRVVERDGLVRIVWHVSDDELVDSYLRPQDVSAKTVVDGIHPLIPAGSDA
ncbi:MAG: hypothetical protein ACK5IN_03545 [Microbacterium sp.]|uniref:PH-like domain-containing protein n=1 Tax=Microbacterium sp. TaxID=51671 RepID=UPI003A8478E3